MDGANAAVDDHLVPPPRLFERLRQIPGYTWDESRAPFHSSYDNWHVFGTKLKHHRDHIRERTIAPLGLNGPGPKEDGGVQSPKLKAAKHTNTFGRDLAVHNSGQTSGRSSRTSDDGSETSRETRGEEDEQVPKSVAVLAKVSTHALREERAYHICLNLIQSVDPAGHHIVRPVDHLRLPAQQGDKGPIVVSIFEAPGPNSLIKYMNFGPKGQARSIKEGETLPESSESISIATALDFAIGATECLELLHHGHRIVHGEIRGDAFHFDEKSGQVRLINFGSGLRSFEHGLTSHGWSTISKEVGAKTKLSFISPEQTGRMPAEPDSRTDIYSLGILLWTLLTQQPAFDGPSPMDIIQSVLARRLPLVSAIRLDVPDVLGRIISKMSAKDINERYHSASGLRHDLVEVQKLLGDGDANGLKHFKLATKDVSSFFILPTVMFGREAERDQIVKVIDKVSTRHAISQKNSPYSLSSGSMSQEGVRRDLFDNLDASSEHTSSAEGQLGSTNAQKSPVVGPGGSHRLSNTTISSRSTTSSAANSADSLESARSNTNRVLKPWEKNTSIQYDTLSAEGSSTTGESVGRMSSSSEGAGGLTHANSEKFKRKGRCEVISIAGTGGLGKSCLVQSVQIEARRRGYFASSKFDSARRSPFGPVLKLLSSLFKQVFSESDTETPFHQVLKQYCRPVWPLLHIILGLPAHLLGPDNSIGRRSSTLKAGYNRNLRPDHNRSESSVSSSARGSPYNMTVGMATQSPQDFLRAGSSTKSLRLMNTFLDVLRVFAQHKFLCFCLDDLQYADDESMELISQLISSKMKVVLIVTYRPEEILPEKIKNILSPPEAEGISYITSGGVGITNIVLKPLSEDDVTRYVAATLCKPAEDIIPLAAVIQSKSAGNPFYMREMLDACNRKGCIYYNYRSSGWEYDLDRIFREFTTETYHDTLNSDFVTRRLAELPPASRAILAWASLIGTSFSFELIQKLLSGEFDYDDDTSSVNSSSPTSDTPGGNTKFTQQEIIAGLQAAIQAYIIITTEDDDKFRFAHDRYIQAASCLKERKTQKMNFVIACTLQKYYFADPMLRDSTASYICSSVAIIRKRIVHRQSFRKILFDSAQRAAENGARPTAVNYYDHCFSLLQEDPWDDSKPDSYYDESLALHIRAAEIHHYMGHFEDASQLLDTLMANAKSAVDKAPAWVLQSRMFAQSGDSAAAFRTLSTCLSHLGVNVDPNPTWDKCDAEFDRISLKLKGTNRRDSHHQNDVPAQSSSDLAAAGAVLVEIIADSFWSSRLTFYSTTLLMVDTALTAGPFPQMGMSFMHLSMIAVSRFNMVQWASELGDQALELMDQWRDPYTLGRAGTIYWLFVGHIQSPLNGCLAQLEGALEYAIASGDRLSTILNFGVVAMLKFFSSDHLTDLESFCQFGCEEIPNWAQDLRGGIMLIAVRQLCRALQGKTLIDSAANVMSDGSHDSIVYLDWVRSQVGEMSDRPLFFYNSLRIAPLFLYGHYEEAIKVGRECLKYMDSVWSARNTRFVMLFYGLALAGKAWSAAGNPAIRNKHAQAEREEIMKELTILRKKIVEWQAVNDCNYLSWSTMLDAQIAELQQNHREVLRLYELSSDHSSAQGFTFEEALSSYLMAGYFLRREARRAAKNALKEATMLFRQMGANGVSRFIEEQHSMLIQGATTSLRTMDMATQTDFAADSAPVQYETMDGKDADERPHTLGSNILESKADRIGAWQSSSARDASNGLPDLDVLDLTSILTSSQVISSVLHVDQLLKTMCDIILDVTSGVASMACIIVEDDDSNGWSIAASGESGDTGGAISHIPGIPLSETSMVASSVILYCTRFRESVFLPDLIHDERFSNVADDWWKKNPLGKSVIAIPIAHGGKPLLGVLYLEGHPNSFTDRNLTVLQLLVNQIGISYSNALTLKAIEKVSASNVSMVESQKRALAKAKEAEAKAIRNFNFAQEAAKAKSIFLANVSHELRTPLNGVIGNSELLRDSGLSKEQAEMADSIRVSADLLLTVINDILDYSKMEADKMKLFNVAFRADEMLREVVRSFTYSNRDKNGTKRVEIREDVKLPPTLIYGDPVRLHQVLGNLIGNSLKFTEKGTITVAARMVKETVDAVELTFSVRDTGIGIPESQTRKLFTPFSQVDTSTARKYGGSGLGLSICKILVESMMKGVIRLESVEGQGTTVWFTITFPKANADASAGDSQNIPKTDPMAGYVKEEPAKDIGFASFENVPRDEVRICIAEDNPINQKIAIQFVQKLGFKHVDAYENGRLAWEGLRARAMEGKPYHLVLMDVQMPVLDGYEATKMIRADDIPAVRSVLVIAMTASAIQGDREKCISSGMNDYLAKPVRVHVLKKKLDQYLKQPAAVLPNLEEEADRVANEVLKNASQQNGTRPALTTRPSIWPSRSSHDGKPLYDSGRSKSYEGKSSEVTITLQEPTPKMDQPKSKKGGGPVNYFEDQTSNDHIRRAVSSSTITQSLNDFHIDGSSNRHEESDRHEESEDVSPGAEPIRKDSVESGVSLESGISSSQFFSEEDENTRTPTVDGAATDGIANHTN